MNATSARAPVSVVIPTTGRPSAFAAVESALRQTVPPEEVVVVFDGDPEDWSLELPESPDVRWVATGRVLGEGPARAVGTSVARGRFVAFLDDDDLWLPRKLEVQLALAVGRSGSARHVLVGSRALLVDARGEVQLRLPRRLIGRDESVAEYLFARRRVRYGESLLYASALLCDRELALATPWRHLPIHADWDWVLRVSCRGDVEVAMAEEPLALIVETPGSASRSGNWRDSLCWAQASRGLLSDRQWADFLLCYTAPLARDGVGRRQALAIARRAVGAGRPGLPALVFFALSTIGPSRLLTRLARLLGLVGSRSRLGRRGAGVS